MAYGVSEKAVLTVAAVVETLLALMFAVWAWYTGYQDRLFPKLIDLGTGVGLALGLLAFNYFLFGPIAQRFVIFASAQRFINEVIKPLVEALDVWSAMLVSLLAGVGEELFFRGVLQNVLGLVAASVLFALLHFGTAVRNYPFVALLYTLIGLYFGWAYLTFHTIWVPIILHIVYDFLAIIFIQRFYFASSSALVD